MLETKLCTIKAIKKELRNTLSNERYKHCLGVVKELEYLFERYGTNNEIIKTENYDAASFLGLVHDWAREYTQNQLYDFCRKENIKLDEDEKRVIVLSHGLVASSIARERCLSVPESWLKAIDEHTCGSVDMGYLGLALFVADFTEENRSFLTKEDREKFHSYKSLNEVGNSVLLSMMNHWQSKGIVPSLKSRELKKYWNDGNLIK